MNIQNIAELPVPLHIELLLGALEDINIPQSRYDSAKSHYEAVGTFLNAEGSFLRVFRPSIYAQGSVALGTAIKPIEGEDFDIDLACQLIYPEYRDPMTVRQLVAKRLKEDSNYARMIDEKKSRCLRLDYADGESFHMDIIAAKFAPETSQTGTAILVPDRSIQNWTHSDPRGFISWFHERKMVRIKQAGLMVLSNVEPLPDQLEVQNKAPLQVCIQLLKRNRDLVFKDQLDLKPISIVITTLAAKVYNNQADLADALWNIVQNMENGFDSVEPSYRLENPTNRNENFTDKWRTEPQLKDAFFVWLRRLKQDIEELYRTRDFQSYSKKLESLIGRKSRDAAMVKQAANMNRSLKDGRLYATKETMAISAAPSLGAFRIPRHTNFGGP